MLNKRVRIAQLRAIALTERHRAAEYQKQLDENDASLSKDEKERLGNWIAEHSLNALRAEWQADQLEKTP